jgi:hypothetical protein
MANESDLAARVQMLESRVDELATMQDLLLRLMSTTRPLSRMLEQYGATETQEEAVYRLLDRVAERTSGSERDLVSFAYFSRGVGEIFTNRRDDREFIQLLIDTLKIERPAYRELHAYMTANRWPIWD